MSTIEHGAAAAVPQGSPQHSCTCACCCIAAAGCWCALKTGETASCDGAVVVSCGDTEVTVPHSF